MEWRKEKAVSFFSFSSFLSNSKHPTGTFYLRFVFMHRVKKSGSLIFFIPPFFSRHTSAFCISLDVRSLTVSLLEANSTLFSTQLFLVFL